MFKCSECGVEYEVKPDYCECGNDTFEEIIPKAQTHSASAPEQVVVKESETTKIPKLNSKNLEVKRASEPPKNYDFVSWALFLFCIILSIVVLFVGNDKDDVKSDSTVKKEQTIVQNIPSVDTFWDNTPIKVEVSSTQQQEQPQIEEIDPIAQKFEQWLNKPKVEEFEPVQTYNRQQVQSSAPKIIEQKPTKQAVNNLQPKVEKLNQPVLQKTLNPSQTPAKDVKTVQSSVTKPASQTKSDNSAKDLLARVQKNAQNALSSQQTHPKTTTQSNVGNSNKSSVAQNPANFQQVKTASTAQTVPTQKPEIRNNQYVQVKSQAELAQELTNYKASLRNTIGKKINFANVVGDGNCAISFKVNSAGKLTNRAFAQQSSNITLNDVVYNAMMSTPSFNPPPEAYKNETMTLKVKIYNGNFEITLN